MFNTPSIRDILERLRRLLHQERLTAVVTRTYPLSEADEAQRAVLEDSFIGKLVIRP
jgi:NADPH:quinone reductase-like Zn-dependent oxidoreductase